MDGFPALPGELQHVLGVLETVEIQGEASEPNEAFGLDNVTLLAPCIEEPPALSLSLDGNRVVLEWGLTPCWQLESTDTLTAPNWTANFPVIGSRAANGLTQVTVNLTTGARFFRLRKP